MGYGEQADIQAGCGGKTDGVSKVDRKYSSGEGGRRESNKAERQE